jgi:hypothetical protein
MALKQKITYILRSEGWNSFVRQAFSFAYNLFFGYGNFLIYEFNFSELLNTDLIKPQVNCSFETITDLVTFEQLVAQGYKFGRRQFAPKLKRGAVGFGLFVDKVQNRVSQHMNNNFSAKRIREGSYLRLFGWHLWKQKRNGKVDSKIVGTYVKQIT